MSKIKGIAVFFALVNILSCVNSNAVQCLDNLTKIENVKPKNEISKNDAKKKKNFKDKFKFLGQKETYKKAWDNMKENKVPYISSAGLAFLLGAIISRKTSKEGLDFLSAEDLTFYTEPYQTDFVEHDGLFGCPYFTSILPLNASNDLVENIKQELTELLSNASTKDYDIQTIQPALSKMEASGIFRYSHISHPGNFPILHINTLYATAFILWSGVDRWKEWCEPLVLKNTRNYFLGITNYEMTTEKKFLRPIAVFHDKNTDKAIVFPIVWKNKNLGNKKIIEPCSFFNPEYYDEIDLKNKNVSRFLLAYPDDISGCIKVKVLSDEEIKQKKEKQLSLANTV